ncbi:MAG: hypothetical protein WD009_15090 [Phycisphaeraceae bacterium]
MLTLAQTEPSGSSNAIINLFETVIPVFSRADTLAHPAKLVEHLSALSIVWAVVFIIAGTCCLLKGYDFYKPVTIMLAALVGLFAGYWLGLHINAPFIVAGSLGLLFAVCAFPLMKYAVALFGGLAGAFVGANVWAGIAYALGQTTTYTLPPNTYWVGALTGLLVCGMLAFIVFNLSIVLFTSVSGATIAVLGAIALLLSFEPWRAAVAEGLTASHLIVPLLVLVPAAIGLILQETWLHNNTAAARTKSESK